MPRTALLAGPALVATGHPLCLAQKMTREQSPEVKFRRANGTITCVSSLIPVEHPIRPSKSKTADCRPNYRTHDGSAKYGTLVCAATRIHYFMDHIISSVCGSLRQNNGSRSNCQGNQLIFHLPSPRTAAGLPLNDKFTQFLTQGRLIRCLTLPVVLGQYRLISLCDQALSFSGVPRTGSQAPEQRGIFHCQLAHIIRDRDLCLPSYVLRSRLSNPMERVVEDGLRSHAAANVVGFPTMMTCSWARVMAV